MKHLFYPAVFHPEETGFTVTVPDIDGCMTQGETLEDAYQMTLDAVGLCLEEHYENNLDFPKASEPQDLSCSAPDFCVLIDFDPLAYRKKHDTKAVKKTLTIPSWLNQMAEQQHINFSKVLQSALKDQLHIDE